MKTLSILLIEDDSDYAALVLAWLSPRADRQDFTVQWTDSLAASKARLAQGGIDLILMDLGLPDASGMATFSAIHAEAPALPIVILSSIEEEAVALQAIQRGAQDYLIKATCTPEILHRTLRHACARHLSAPQAQSDAEAPQARLAAVFGGTGGAGTTTIAAVLAAELARQSGHRALLMDLDLSPGLVAFTTGVDPHYSVQDALGRAYGLDSSIWEDLVTRCEDSLDVLGTSRMKIPVVPGQFDIAALRELLSFARTTYSWIVLDVGRLNHFSMDLIRVSEDRFLVASPEIPSLNQCKHALEILETAGVERRQVRMILNRRDNSQRLSSEQIRKLFGIDVSATLPPSQDDLYKACLRKQLPPVTCRFRKALAGVARELTGVEESPAGRVAAGPLSAITGMFRNLTDVNAG